MKLKLFLLILLGIPAAILLIFLFLMLLTGKGTITPFLDSNGQVLEGSVSEKVYLNVNGTKNGMIIRGKDTTKPVLLFISGGPGVPQYWLNEVYSNRLEEVFTVCWWDYAGEGLSYDSSLKPEELTLERLEEDAVFVTQYLKDRFNTEKVCLMAHSGGTPLALDLVQKHPELYSCYFGMGQIVNDGGANSRYMAGYRFMKPLLEEKGDQKTLTRMEALVTVHADGTITPNDPETIASKWEGILLASGCATTRDMRSDAVGIFLPVMLSKCYTFSEKINFWRGKFLYDQSDYKKTKTYLEPEYDFSIPVYFLNGYYDYTCPTSLVEEYYKKLNAPDKDICIFPDSAHSPLWEENEKVLQFMVEAYKKH